MSTQTREDNPVVMHGPQYGAAGSWQEGWPDEPGRYLVEYEQKSVRKVFVMDYGLNDHGELSWHTHATEAKVLRWAPINSEYA